MAAVAAGGRKGFPDKRQMERLVRLGTLDGSWKGWRGDLAEPDSQHDVHLYTCFTLLHFAAPCFKELTSEHCLLF